MKTQRNTDLLKDLKFFKSVKNINLALKKLSREKVRKLILVNQNKDIAN